MAEQNKNKTNLFRPESLERLSSPEQLDQLMQIVNSRSWIPLASMGALMGIGLLWSIFGTISITVSGKGLLVYSEDNSDELVGLAYFPTSEGQQIQPGMEVLLIPEGVSAARTGGIMAEVETISMPPVTTLTLAQEAIASDPSPLYDSRIEVLARLKSTDDTASGYEWSSANGDKMMISPGSTAYVRVTLAKQAPITFVFPFLAQ
ncbi:MAG: hypothetical protein VKJ64_21420 [Leptolyngbyaceae bacterium]|nr:hypothetical protein [Leptolyngbyaceae bacterium]